LILTGTGELFSLLNIHVTRVEKYTFKRVSLFQNYNYTIFRSVLKRVKAVPLQAWSGPAGSRKLRFPDYMTTAQDGCKVVSLTHRLPLPTGNAPGTHFC
jgi:hypothetical protein